MRLLSALVLSAVLTSGLMARRRPPHLDVEPFPGPVRWAIAVALLVVVLAITVFLPLEGLFGEAAAPDLENVSFPTLFAGHAVLGGFLVLWWALSGFPAPARFLHLPLAEPLRRVWVGVGAGLGGWVLTMAAMVTFALVLALLRPGDDPAADGISPGGVGEIPDVVRFLVGLPPWRRLLLVVSAGIFEEAFFRSFLQPRAGLLLSTALFTVSHASYALPFMLVGVFTVSLVLGWLFRTRRDVLPCMVAHAVFDAVQLFVVLPLGVSA